MTLLTLVAVERVDVPVVLEAKPSMLEKVREAGKAGSELSLFTQKHS